MVSGPVSCWSATLDPPHSWILRRFSILIYFLRRNIPRMRGLSLCLFMQLKWMRAPAECPCLLRRALAHAEVRVANQPPETTLLCSELLVSSAVNFIGYGGRNERGCFSIEPSHVLCARLVSLRFGILAGGANIHVCELLVKLLAECVFSVQE